MVDHSKEVSFSLPPSQDIIATYPVQQTSFTSQMNTTMSFPTNNTFQPTFLDTPITYSRPCYENNAVPIVIREKEIRVTRYGRIFKRKSPSKYGFQYSQTSKPGCRFCKFCNALLPLDAFYKVTKRYVCRAHHYLRVQLRRENDLKNDKYWNCAYSSWDMLKEFLPSYLGIEKVNFDKQDIKQILVTLDIPLRILPRFLPIDPSLPLRPRNIAIVSNRAFKLIVSLYKFSPVRPMYIYLVQRFNLIPKSFDVGNINNPYEDPNYVRDDIDVSELFKKEFIAGEECTPEFLDRDIIEEYQNKGNVPWLTCEKLPPGEAGFWIDGAPVFTSTESTASKRKNKKHKKIDIQQDDNVGNETIKQP
jgi:hypothetical protein